MGKGFDVVGRGFAGWHASRPGCNSSGGTLNGYAAESEDGALVYDASDLDADPADCADYVRLVVNGPLPDPALPRGTRDVFTWPRTGPAPLALGEPAGPFDRVSLDHHAHALWQVGARVGWVRNGRVEWATR